MVSCLSTEVVSPRKIFFINQPIWQNSLIRIENKPVFHTNLFSLGISKVKNFVREKHNFLSHTDFIEKYNCQFQPLKYFGLEFKQVKNSSISQTLLFQSRQIHFLLYSLRTQKELRSSTKNLFVKKRSPRREVRQNGTLRFLIRMQHIPWLSSVLKARHLLIFNIDFCIEHFPQTRF